MGYSTSLCQGGMSAKEYISLAYDILGVVGPEHGSLIAYKFRKGIGCAIVKTALRPASAARMHYSRWFEIFQRGSRGEPKPELD